MNCGACGHPKRVMYHGGQVCDHCTVARRKAKGEAAKTAAPLPAARREGLPWATKPVCDAVKVGINSATAQKRGLFYVVKLTAAFTGTFVPCPQTPLPGTGRESILLVARLEAGKWRLRPHREYAAS